MSHSVVFLSWGADRVEVSYIFKKGEYPLVILANSGLSLTGRAVVLEPLVYFLLNFGSLFLKVYSVI